MRCLALLGLVSVLTCSGCGGGTGPSGTVSGTVTKGGQALPDVTVSFLGGTGASSATTDASGKYTVPEPLPVGKYQASVNKASTGGTTDVSSADYAKTMSGGAAAAKPQKDTTVDVKYQSFSTSKLELEVKEGENSFDVKLE